MGVPDPPWLIKTRPCPFFQQGRCIFDHKCNFVHSIRSPLTIRVPLGYELDITLSDLASPSPSPAGQFLQPHAVSRQASPPTKPADTPRTSASDASAPFRPKAAKPILGTASFRAALEEKLRVRQGLIYKHVSQPPSPPDLEPEEEFTFEHIETPTTPPEHNEEFEPTFNNIITSSTPNRYGQQSSFSPEFSSIHSPDVRDVDTELSDPTLTYKSPAVFTRHNPSAPPSPSTQVPLSNAGSPIPFSYDVPIRRSLEHSPTLSTVRAPIHSLPENDFRQSLGHPLSPDDLEPNDEPLSDDEDEDDVTARIATVKGPLRILSPPRIQSSPVSPASRDIEVYEADMAINPFQPSPQLSPQLSPQHSPQPSPRQSLRQSPQYTLRHSLQHSPEHSPQQVRRAESIDLLEETAPAEGFFKVDENFTTLSPRHSDASLSSDGSEDDQSHPPASYQIEAFETQKNIVVSPPPPPPPENPEPTMSTRPWLKQLRLPSLFDSQSTSHRSSISLASTQSGRTGTISLLENITITPSQPILDVPEDSESPTDIVNLADRPQLLSPPIGPVETTQPTSSISPLLSYSPEPTYLTSPPNKQSRFPMRPPLSASSSAPDLHSSPFYPSASAGPRSATLPSYETQWNQPGSPSSSQFRDAPSTIKSSLQSFSIDHRSPPRSRSGSALSVTSSTSGIVNSQLYFAIASDRPSEVQRLLETGEVSPNDGSGPQNPLVFAASNEHLEHRSEIVRTLLAHGADPSVLDKHEQPESITENQDPQRNSLKAYDPSVRYYVSQAMNYKDHKPSAAIKSVPKFAPLARLRFKLIGQTLVLDEFYRALSIQALRGDNVPLVVLFCGPSGHGKSLMSRQVGDLLGCPIRFVNMTTLSSTQDVWDARSQSPTTDVIQSLGDFMCENEGKRCIVVLDEIEKTLNPRVLWALLVPWELGYCTLSSGRQVNTKEVIWIGISNLGQSMVLEASSLTEPAAGLSVGAYRELMSRVREKLSDELGSSLLSRVTAVLPFTPFSQEELEALAYDAVVATVTQRQTPLTEEDMTKVVGEAVRNYLPKEGARSLFRAVAEQMLDL